MGNRITILFLLFVLASVLSGMMAGGDGYAITTLSAPMNKTDVVAFVDTTGGFIPQSTPPGGVAAHIYIDNEELTYTNGTSPTEFTGIVRGTDNTEAATHSVGAKVYTQDANTAAYAIGFDIGKTIQNGGILGFPAVLFGFFFVSLPRLIEFNWAFMQGGLWWIAIPFYGIGLGLIVTLGIAFFGTKVN